MRVSARATCALHADFRRVSAAYAATSAAHVAAGLREMDIFSTAVPIPCSPSPSFPFLRPAAAYR